TDMNHANLTNANLTRITFPGGLRDFGANVTGANFTGVEARNAALGPLSITGLTVTQIRQIGTSLYSPLSLGLGPSCPTSQGLSTLIALDDADFTLANFSAGDLHGIQFGNIANILLPPPGPMQGATFAGANLTCSSFYGLPLSGVNMSGVNLT